MVVWLRGIPLSSINVLTLGQAGFSTGMSEFCGFDSRSSWYLTSHPVQLNLAIPTCHVGRGTEYQQKLGRKQVTELSVSCLHIFSFPD